MLKEISLLNQMIRNFKKDSNITSRDYTSIFETKAPNFRGNHEYS
jgi:hypothetical protein